MGTFGAGNFENDTAADYLADLIGNIIEDVRENMKEAPLALEADEFGGDSVPCAVQLLTLIGNQKLLGFYLPPVTEIEQWKSTFMDAWLGSIDDLDPDEDYKEDRIAVLNKTFDDLIDLARKYDQD